MAEVSPPGPAPTMISLGLAISSSLLVDFGICE